MRVLILGGAGMLGHKVARVLCDQFDVWETVRSVRGLPTGVLDPASLCSGVEAGNQDSVIAAFAATRPDVVVNCIGIVKQSRDAQNAVKSLTVNSLFPHRLAALCATGGARFIHISTDCVFSGRRGGYTEADTPDAEDLYGRTKLLGELTDGAALTLRTSIIGRQLSGTDGLLEWFLQHRGGEVSGYTRAVFSGLTTLALSELLARVISEHPNLAGLYHVSTAPIDKHDLLCRLNDAFQVGARVIPDDRVRIDRSLDSQLFQEATGWRPPDWDAMIQEAAGDAGPYDEWRRE